MVRKSLSGHSDDRRCRGILFQAPIAAAPARDSEGFDAYVTYLSRRSVGPTKRLSVDYNAATNASPQRDADGVLYSARGSQPVLPDPCRGGIIFDDHRNIELACDRRTQLKPVEFRKVGGPHHTPRTGIEGRGYRRPDGHSQTSVEGLATFTRYLGH